MSKWVFYLQRQNWNFNSESNNNYKFGSKWLQKKTNFYLAGHYLVIPYCIQDIDSGFSFYHFVHYIFCMKWKQSFKINK